MKRPGKIDLHTHILPKDWPNLREKYGYGGFVQLDHHKTGCAKMMIDGKFFREIGENCWNPEVRIKEKAKSKVDLQVLSTVPVMFSYWAKPQHALDLSRLLNDHLAGVVQRYPDDFAGLGTLPMQDPGLAVQELERCVNDLKLSGVQIGTHVNEWNLDEPALFPVFERASQLGAAIFVHPWDMLGKDRMTRYMLPWLVGMPAETSLALCSLIFGGVLERLPKLRICFAHGGGAFSGTLGRIEQGFRARPDLCAVKTRRSPKKHLRSVYFDSLVHDADALRLLIKRFGAGRIALGTDYPFPLGEDKPGALIGSMRDLSPKIKARLLAGTAREFLGL